MALGTKDLLILRSVQIVLGMVIVLILVTQNSFPYGFTSFTKWTCGLSAACTFIIAGVVVSRGKVMGRYGPIIILYCDMVLGLLLALAAWVLIVMTTYLGSYNSRGRRFCEANQCMQYILCSVLAIFAAAVAMTLALLNMWDIFTMRTLAEGTRSGAAVSLPIWGYPVAQPSSVPPATGPSYNAPPPSAPPASDFGWQNTFLGATANPTVAAA